MRVYHDDEVKYERLNELNPHREAWVKIYALEKAIEGVFHNTFKLVNDADVQDLREHLSFIRILNEFKIMTDLASEHISDFLKNADA